MSRCLTPGLNLCWYHFPPRGPYLISSTCPGRCGFSNDRLMAYRVTCVRRIRVRRSFSICSRLHFRHTPCVMDGSPYSTRWPRYLPHHAQTALMDRRLLECHDGPYPSLYRGHPGDRSCSRPLIRTRDDSSRDIRHHMNVSTRSPARVTRAGPP